MISSRAASLRLAAASLCKHQPPTSILCVQRRSYGASDERPPPALLSSRALRHHQRAAFSSKSNSIAEHISELVAETDVVVFMKGVPEQPRCGFSNAVVQIFRMHDVTFKAHDVLQDEELRQGIKEFSSWPTIPQVYFRGEFIGGCDILLQMHQSGELVDELKKIDIRSALLNEEDDEKRNDEK